MEHQRRPLREPSGTNVCLQYLTRAARCQDVRYLPLGRAVILHRRGQHDGARESSFASAESSHAASVRAPIRLGIVIHPGDWDWADVEHGKGRRAHAANGGRDAVGILRRNVEADLDWLLLQRVDWTDVV
jgi:hypothetical protein